MMSFVVTPGMLWVASWGEALHLCDINTGIFNYASEL